MAGDRLLFFATDIHGSARCFRKWLNAAEAYGADVLVLGGDIVAKSIVPIEQRNGGRWVASWRDEVHELHSLAELEAFARQLADLGAYAWRAAPDEAAAVIEDEEAEHALFTRLATERMREWAALARKRLAGRKVKAYVMAGNDDPFEIDDVLEEAGPLVLCDRRLVWIDDWLPMISMGDSTPTPWHTPRELDEPDLAAALETMIGELDDPSRAIFNLHCPPRDTEIDSAPELDEQLNVKFSLGEMSYAPVGSTSVREAIERHQPLLGLHGHVHEGRGRYRIGRTDCFNPGSDYKQGVLRGVVLRLSPERGLRDYTFTMG